MASQKGDLKPGTYDIKLGESWDTPSRDRTTFHTLKYDFKPKSVANETETYVAVGQNGDVQVAVPAENDSLTMYKGAQKQLKEAKECLLFFNPKTGEVRLEKVTSNITVKKTRPGDTEPATEQYLRSEIARLRTTSTSKRPKSEERECQSPVLNEDSDRKRKASSSDSSSSSDGSSSSSDSEEEENFRDAPTLSVGHSGTVPPQESWPPVPQQGQPLSNASSPMDMSDSDEDEEMSKQLERAIAEQCAPPPSSSHPNCESMPFLDMSSPPRLAPPAPVATTKSALYNDLALSESSDEDD